MSRNTSLNPCPRLTQVLALLFLALGCGGREPRQLSLLDASPAPTLTPDADAESKRLAQMQLIHAHDVANDEDITLDVDEVPAYIEPGGGFDAELLGGSCGMDVVCSQVDFFPGNCLFNACKMKVYECVAQTLRDIALIRAQPVKVRSPNSAPDAPYALSFPAQEAPARAALLRTAEKIAQAGLDWASNFYGCQIPDPPGSSADAVAQTIPGVLTTAEGPAAGAFYAEQAGELLRLTQDIAFDAVDAVVAVADSQRSTTLDIKAGAARAVSGAQLSRAEAAHILIGGNPGLLGSVANPFCASDELTGRARKALAMIRRAAPSPVTVQALKTITMDAFLNGTQAGLPEGSIAVRLAYLDGKCSNAVVPVCPVTKMEEQTGISTEDFTQARNYLSDEISAFARSTTVTFTPSRIGTSPALGLQFFAATRSEPSPAPPEYYAALARYSPNGYIPPTSWVGEPNLAMNLNQAFINLKTSAPALIALAKASPGLGGQAETYPQQYTLIDGVLSTALAGDPRKGILLRSAITNGTWLLGVHGYTAADNIRIVTGMDGLLCATTGFIEGVRCTDLTPYTLARFTTNGFAQFGYTTAATWVGSVPESLTVPYFVVKPKNSAQEVPGGYEHLTGFMDTWTPTNLSFKQPMVPEFDRKAGEILRPSHNSCTHSAVECDGTYFDERLPLENELSDDNDGVETSWKHYLSLAEAAAAESDTLGEQYIQNGIEVDREKEIEELRQQADEQRFASQSQAELETVQDICGTAESTDDLLTQLGVDLSGMSTNKGPCAVNDDCCKPEAAGCTHSTCVGGTCKAHACSVDADCCPANTQCSFKCDQAAKTCGRTIEGIITAPSTSESISRIKECIGDGTVADYAVIGSKALCVWTKSDNVNDICYGQSAQYPCPVPALVDASGHNTCSGLVPPAGASAPELVDQWPLTPTPGKPQLDVKLNFIPNGTNQLLADPCNDLRQLRHNLGRDAACGRIMAFDLADEYFVGTEGGDDADLVDTLKANYTFSDTLGPRVDIVQDKKTRWSTSGADGLTNYWPCNTIGGVSAADCVTVPNSLFCQRVNCGSNPSAADLQQIAAVNQRLVEAIVLLQGMAHAHFENITLPVTYAPADMTAIGAVITGQYNDTGPWRRQPYSGNWPFWMSTINGTLSLQPGMTFEGFFTNGATGTVPVFYKFYAPGNPTPTDYPIQASTVSTRALVPGPKMLRTFDTLNTLPLNTQFCGNHQSTEFNVDPKNTWRFTITSAVPQGFSFIPKGNGLASSEQTLLNRQAPDLPYLTTRFRYDDQGVADAAELLCEAERGILTKSPANTACGADIDPTQLTKTEDFDNVTAWVDCKVADFQRTMGALLLPKIPVRVIQNLHDSAQGAFPAVGGQMAVQMQNLRAALIRFGEQNAAMRDAAESLKDAVSDLQTLIKEVQVRQDLEELDSQVANLSGMQARIRVRQIDFQQQAAWIKGAMGCVQAFGHAVSNAVLSFGGSAAAAAADCAASMVDASLDAQTLGYEKQIAQIETEIADVHSQQAVEQGEYDLLEKGRDIVKARATIRSLSGRMAQISDDTRASFEDIRGALAGLEGLRLKALRALGRAMQYQSTTAAITANIDSALNAKLDTSKMRYQQAHKNAINLTFLAKRAIEQRLGVHLSDLRADLPLVDAPATWESLICTSEGVDYSAISGNISNVPKNFAGTYIGDLVGKLKNTVESYRLQYDFHEGIDEAIVSVRDDVFGTRQSCAQSLGNLLTYSGDLRTFVSDPALPGWLITGCTAGPNGISSTCLNVQKDTTGPLNLGAAEGAAPGWVVTWGSAANLSESLTQRVATNVGRYRLSWFSKDIAGTTASPMIDMGVLDPNGASVTSTTGTGGTNGRYIVGNTSGANVAGTYNGWTRYYRIFDLKTAGNSTVKLLTAALQSRAGSVAGIMFEALQPQDSKSDPVDLRPGAYVATGLDTTRMIKACEDTDGSAFRATAFTRRCEHLCSNGFSGSCEQSDRPSSCYWESTIGLDQRDLEEGRIFQHAGFAKGNYNYRIEDVAVNFVGTETRDCSNSPNPSACAGAGFIPYSITHLGPYFVRNHEGADFKTTLFTGIIEHARGVALERYVTNPLSDTDRSLLTPYIRKEFQGRPFDGSFLLKIWDEEGVNFDAISDVQLYIKYRYWTRSQ